MIDSRLNRETRTRWILDMLATRGPMTPAEIAEQLGLTVRHAQLVVRELGAQGLVYPAPGRRGHGRRGRLPTRWEADRKSRYAQDLWAQSHYRLRGKR